MTLEDSITFALTNLCETNEVIDDVQNKKDSANLNIGTFHKIYAAIGVARWSRDHQQARVGRYFAGRPYDDSGLRSAVA